MQELWLPVVGYEGLYEVSDQGRVRRNGRVLRPITTVGCYASVSLSRKGVRKRQYVHTLVLTAFVGPRPAGHNACHGPTGGFDNSLRNLRWGTQASNLADRERDGTVNRGERNGMAKLTDEKVRLVRELVAAGRAYTEVAQLVGVHKMQVSRVRRGITWKHIQ